MYKLIVDSCCDISPEAKIDIPVIKVPLSITVGNEVFVDDAKLDISKLLSSMKACSTSPSTACPSPGDFSDAMSGEDDVFVVTMSKHLSGTFQSAMAGKELKSGSGRVYIFDSKSASSGQGRVVDFIVEQIAQDLSFDEIIKRTLNFIEEMDTFFVLESLDNLIKNGRMSRFVGSVASILSLRPIMGADDGKIALLEKARGTAKAMAKLAAHVQHKVAHLKATGKAVPETLYIAHCNCYDRACSVKDDILKSCTEIKKVLISATAGISTVYANEGGVIIAY